jgi:hypothetical protein
MAASMAAFEHFVRTGDVTYIPHQRKAESGMTHPNAYSQEVSAELVETLIAKTGLHPDTVRNLLHSGYRWVEKIGEISRWEHPMWQLQELTTHRGI